MTIHDIIPDPDGGTVSIRIADDTRPHMLAGVVWQFNEQNRYQQRVGLFTTSSPTLALGAPRAIKGKKFAVEGAVLRSEPPDDPPVPFAVRVRVTQDGQTLLDSSPDGGSGDLSDEDRPFVLNIEVRS